MYARLVCIHLLFLLSPLTGYAMLESMELHGQGTARYLGFIKVYDAYLFTGKPVAPDRVMDNDVSKCLKIEYAVSMSVDNFIEGANTVLERQYNELQLSEFYSEINALHQKYRAVEKGDTYILCYDDSKNLITMALNEEKLLAITSRNFAKLYFGIWLGEEKPLDETLRNSLLAR